MFDTGEKGQQLLEQEHSLGASRDCLEIFRATVESAEPTVLRNLGSALCPLSHPTSTLSTHPGWLHLTFKEKRIPAEGKRA